MRTESVDLRPRMVWLGLTVPGKKMMRMIAEVEGYDFRERGTILIELYRDEPHRVLMKVAVALHYLPEQGTYGPALRDLTTKLEDISFDQYLFGAVITDIRDFLKLRFRGKGLVDVSTTEMLARLRTGSLPPGVEPSQPGTVINYVISALDALSRDQSGKTDLPATLKSLRNLLRETAKELDPARLTFQSAAELMDEFYDRLFGED